MLTNARMILSFSCSCKLKWRVGAQNENKQKQAVASVCKCLRERNQRVWKHGNDPGMPMKTAPQGLENRLDLVLVGGNGGMHLSNRALDKHSAHKAEALAGGLEINHCLQNELVFMVICGELEDAAITHSSGNEKRAMKRGENLALTLRFWTRGRWHPCAWLGTAAAAAPGPQHRPLSNTVYTADQMNGLKDSRHCTVNAATCAVVPSSVASAQLQRRDDDQMSPAAGCCAAPAPSSSSAAQSAARREQEHTNQMRLLRGPDDTTLPTLSLKTFVD